MVDNLAAAALAVLLPESCCFCDAQIDEGPACATCCARLPWHENTAPDRSWAAFRYEPVIAAQILDLKFHAQLAPARRLGTLMAGRLTRRPEPLPDLLIPVPLHPARLARRGYNQALEIARAIAAHLAIELAPRAARRVRMTEEQTRLSGAERRRNVRGAFEVGDAVRGRRIAIVDDVITTGATTGELARTARLAGARCIEVWAAARVG